MASARDRLKKVFRALEMINRAKKFRVSPKTLKNIQKQEDLIMYVIMLLRNGRRTVKPLDGERREAIMAYAGRGFSNLFLRGYTLTNAL